MSKLKIPESWAECLLPNFVDLKNGQTPKNLPAEQANGEIPFIKVSDMNSPENTTGINSSKILLTKKDIEKYGLKLIPEKAVIFPKNGGALLTNKKRYTVKQSAIDTNIMAAVPPEETFSYFWNWFQIIDFNKFASGSTVPMISFNDIKDISVPIPPLKEQQRIVAKIESTKEKIKTIASNVEQAEALIEKYREAILQKAFRGQLVPQNPNDEPASKLLERIRVERDKLADPKKKKKDDLPPIKPEEIPFEIPKSWEWVRLGELKLITGNTPKQIPKTKNDIPFYKPADFSYKGDIFVKTSEDSSSSSYTYREVKAGSVVLVCIGATLGKSGIVIKDGAFNQQNNAVLPNTLIDSEFLCFWFRSQTFQNKLWKINSSTTMPIVNKTQMENLLFPLCSLSEQRKIVQIFKMKFGILNEIKALANQKKQQATILTNAILQSAFIGSLVPQDSTEGTGQELLQKIRIQQLNENNQKSPADKTANKKSRTLK